MHTTVAVRTRSQGMFYAHNCGGEDKVPGDVQSAVDEGVYMYVYHLQVVCACVSVNPPT